jgi:hypothetical protein
LCAGMFLVFGAQISIKMALRLLNRNKHWYGQKISLQLYSKTEHKPANEMLVVNLILKLLPQ